ncbi:MAG: hypothetical protein WC702_04040 [Patescibacteria group bacterium]|jgi:hypothetical protein
MSFPPLNAHLPVEVLENLPDNLFFTGYFAVYPTEEDPEPEAITPGSGSLDRHMREVMDFRGEALTGQEIADILKAHGNWFVFYDFVLQDPSTA